MKRLRPHVYISQICSIPLKGTAYIVVDTSLTIPRVETYFEDLTGRKHPISVFLDEIQRYVALARQAEEDVAMKEEVSHAKDGA